jgi:hypothetical protein
MRLPVYFGITKCRRQSEANNGAILTLELWLSNLMGNNMVARCRFFLLYHSTTLIHSFFSLYGYYHPSSSTIIALSVSASFSVIWNRTKQGTNCWINMIITQYCMQYNILYTGWPIQSIWDVSNHNKYNHTYHLIPMAYSHSIII